MMSHTKRCLYCLEEFEEQVRELDQVYARQEADEED